MNVSLAREIVASLGQADNTLVCWCLLCWQQSC